MSLENDAIHTQGGPGIRLVKNPTDAGGLWEVTHFPEASQLVKQLVGHLLTDPRFTKYITQVISCPPAWHGACTFAANIQPLLPHLGQSLQTNLCDMDFCAATRALSPLP